MKYWPNTTTDKLSFFAYAPYVDESAAGGSNPSFQGNTVAGFPKLTYTVPTTEADQIDLLCLRPVDEPDLRNDKWQCEFPAETCFDKSKRLYQER